MKKTSLVRLGFSAIFLAAVGYGAVLHARDHSAAKPVLQKVTFAVEKIAAEDMDIVGVVGDVFVDGCKAGDARCGKAWKDLGDLAGKGSL
jgi:hypothetical protein